VKIQLDTDQRRIQLVFEEKEKLLEPCKPFQATLFNGEARFEVPVHVRQVFPGRAGREIGRFTMPGRAP